MGLPHGWWRSFTSKFELYVFRYVGEISIKEQEGVTPVE